MARIGSDVVILIGPTIFFIVSPRYEKDVYVKSFPPRTAARLWNYLPTKNFPLTYHQIFLISFSMCFLSLPFFSCNPMPFSGCLVLCGI